MICFSSGGHYLGFFRRILIKIQDIVSIEKNVPQQLRDLEREITPSTEWIQYNDTEMKFVTANWPGVLERCIEQSFYPTVVFYEKLISDRRDDNQYRASLEFDLGSRDLEDLASLAQQMDILQSSNMEEIYGQDEI